MATQRNNTQVPNFRDYDYAAMVRKSWGKEYNRPETGYAFTNGRTFHDPAHRGGPYTS